MMRPQHAGHHFAPARARFDSSCLLVTDTRYGPEPWFPLTGDTRFVDGVGRPDLAGDEPKMAGMLFDAPPRKRLTLPVHLEFFPGDLAGSNCGTGLCGKPSATLGSGKHLNPLLAVKDRKKSICHIAVTGMLPLRPAEMDRIALSLLLCKIAVFLP